MATSFAALEIELIKPASFCGLSRLANEVSHNVTGPPE
jgi:hypothetical protein